MTRLTLDRMEELGIGRLWKARKPNGHLMNCYVCIDGMVHNYDKRHKTYDARSVHFIEPVSHYSGPNPKQFKK